jgi:hypothetical protein
MEKQFRALPDEYRLEVEKEKMGTIERLQYIVPNLGNGKDIKHLNVYLPYCYDTNDKNIKYNVLYLMHGGGEDENLIFGGPGQVKSKIVCKLPRLLNSSQPDTQ